MFKRLLYTFMIIIAIGSIGLGLYRFYEANDTHATINTNDVTIEYDGVAQYALSSGISSTNYFFFCTAKNNNCQYVLNTLYSDVNNKLKNKRIDDIVEFVDIQPLIDEGTIERLSSDWGINNFPAFISVSNNYGELTINNSLVWDDTNPMGTIDILNWLALNGQYDGEILEEVLVP
ncbi:MAG: hypothetical protein MR210_07375 [Erysipelotrichaceae bacterium]|nr:hypothetical protein [Erysipelotrichaceae bacterium]MDY5252486.1 hypothetical protein [Erysipelotrichaceae bacterium]